MLRVKCCVFGYFVCVSRKLWIFENDFQKLFWLVLIFTRSMTKDEVNIHYDTYNMDKCVKLEDVLPIDGKIDYE